MKPSPGGATCHPLLSPPRYCFAVILSPGALRVKRVDGSDGSRAVTWPMTSQLYICMSRDLSIEAAILFCCHVVLRWYSHHFAVILSPGAPQGLILIGREPSRDLWRLYLHKLAYIAPFCGETVTRGRYGSIVSTVCDLVSTALIGRKPSRDLWRHSSFA